MSYTTTQPSVLLCPRPLARYAGQLLLVSLLPPRPPLKHLPGEIWSKIFQFVLWGDSDGIYGSSRQPGSMRFLLISKGFKEIILPILYSHVTIASIGALQKFVAHLTASDKAWDSIRRIPYSTPGRWIHSLDLGYLHYDGSSIEDSRLHIDMLLTSMWPLVPFLRQCVLTPMMGLSRRALDALALSDSAGHLRSLKGMKISETSVNISTLQSDPLVQLLRYCPGIEELEVVGPGLDTSDFDFLLPTRSSAGEDDTIPFYPLHLPALRTLTLLSLHSGPLLYALLHTRLPSLRTLTLTPYHEVASSLVTAFIAAHGPSLTSLLLYTPKVWPTSLCTSPPDLLISCPNLRHLSLEAPLPDLVLPPKHHLQVLSLPRPNGVLLGKLEGAIQNFPDLRAVRARDVKWLRKGMALRAQEAGVQGQMRDWMRRLVRKQVRVLDSEWKDGMQ
ncbi:hypothetical protein PUNSTDRAFT_55592 [Punctularia strigosozonata HHB-11173 SS5]|uniref:F-box domain-containing protein n=1 Tax=Punctularia strigosozonata (strain HHB-11173) TaxID=741275 RepID=R7S253_PUNST|nr:uncharacterized protein PUNSTDRAFT_55592 [Punctularia strigosozonata HHB-11173 SS5]EIN04268.1 hypothetical protein PUNSTDRAFT_55592 [Punctularia strigosozonata HHB-11173 SS5]